MPHLNFHHLRYFWTIATEGSMSRAAARLNVSPSSLSVQLKALEQQLGQQLFERRGRALHLTEAGRIALDYASTVLQSGHQLIEALNGLRPGRVMLRVGATATLSRNFQMALLRPLLGKPDVELVIRSGVQADLLQQLDAHKLDLVLSNHPAPADAEAVFENILLDEQAVSLVGHPSPARKRFRFPKDIADAPLVVPAQGSAIRSAFDALMGREGIRPNIVAEIDDMAMLRLMARANPGLTLVPPVVVVDELRTKILVEVTRLKGITEQFFAITQQRRFPNPLVETLVRQRRK
ncbi:MAG: LysR family transcriptional regulator [Hyphomicrobiales bacterium]|nr:MAG: LysR family transcriptional regulator [Hyphomicrobiales bacterium]